MMLEHTSNAQATLSLCTLIRQHPLTSVLSLSSSINKHIQAPSQEIAAAAAAAMADDVMEELRQVYSALDTRDLLDELRNRGLRADGVRCLCVPCMSMCVCGSRFWSERLDLPPSLSNTLASSSTHARTHT